MRLYLKTLFLVWILVVEAMISPSLYAGEGCVVVSSQTESGSFEVPVSEVNDGDGHSHFFVGKPDLDKISKTLEKSDFGGHLVEKMSTLGLKTLDAISSSSDSGFTLENGDKVIKNLDVQYDRFSKVYVRQSVAVVRCSPQGLPNNLPTIDNQPLVGNNLPQARPELHAFYNDNLSYDQFQSQVESEERDLVDQMDRSLTDSNRIADSLEGQQVEASERHNNLGKAVFNELRSSVPELPLLDKDTKLLTPKSAPEYQKLSAALNYHRAARKVVEGKTDYKEERQNLLDVAEAQIHVADSYYSEGDSKNGDSLLEGAKVSLDVATDFIPGVSLAKDIISIGTGINPVTGESITDLQKGFLIAGLVVPATLKGSSKWISRGISRLNFVAKVKDLPSAQKMMNLFNRAAEGFAGLFGRTEKTLVNHLDEASKLGFKTPEGMKVYEKLAPHLNNLPNDLKVVRVFEGKDPSKIAVIGTNMRERVAPAAQSLEKNLAHEVQIFDVSRVPEMKEAQDRFNLLTQNGTVILSDAEVKTTDLFKEDMKWIQKMKDQGYTILNLGKTKESVWYKGEIETLGWE